VVSETRGRMIEATVAGLQLHGVAGMSFTDVLAASGAARGAIYHHFPNGKAELVAAAAEHNGREVQVALASLPGATATGLVDAFIEMIRPVIDAAAAGCGCAVAAVTVDARGHADPLLLRAVAAGALDSWIDALATRLRATGLPRRSAADQATALVALLEGAQVLCRAAGSAEPFEPVARAMRGLVGPGGRRRPSTRSVRPPD
jgi:TetR/AcrR family transcriptional repressor of lmrAB and yxaGH operons